MARETVTVLGLEGVLKTLQALPPALVSKSGGPVKLSLKKAADVLLTEAKANVRRIIDMPDKNGENKSTGLLLLSLQAKRHPPGGNKKGEMIAVSIARGKKYPAFRQDRAGDLTATQIGRQLEFGTARRPPMPWLRPAFDAKKMEALRVFVEDINMRLVALIKKVEQESGARL